MRGHRQIDHTADLAFEIWAESEAELLEEAGRALVEIMTEGGDIATEAQRVVELEALDREDRLVRWLNEVIFLAVDSGFLMHSAELRLDGETGLSGRLAGTERADLLRTELKSATYHDLLLEDRFARFVIDV